MPSIPFRWLSERKATRKHTEVLLKSASALSLFAPFGQARGDDAEKILRALSDHLASQRNISLTFDADIEVITPDVQKIQFASSGRVQMSRPDKIRASRTG